MLRTIVRKPTAVAPILKRFNSSSTENLLKTPFYDLHLELGGTMVPYAGFSMPVLYKSQSHIESHNWVRSKAGLFDVSHMLQHKIQGPKSTEFLEKITPSDLKSLEPFSSTLSVILNSNGGVVDDTIITKHGEDEFYVVTNAGCREKDLKFIGEELQNFQQVSRSDITGGLLAFQGPEAAPILQKLTTYDLNTLKFGHSAFIPLSIGGDKYHVARGGYTGEDGFEISIPDEVKANEFARILLNDFPDTVRAIGLAARDSLRLEAGMCLYGHELSEEITPVEAGLTWVIGKNRRDPATAGFNGAEKILAQVADKSLVKKVRRGITVKGPAARENMDVYTGDSTSVDAGTKIGVVTSGSFSPSTKQNIGMVYVPRKYMKVGTELKVNVRGKLREAKIAKMPFIEPNYFR